MSRSIEIEIPTFGGIKVSRSNQESNDDLMKLLLEVVEVEDKEQVKKFFEDEKKVKLLYGKDSLCG